MPDQYTTSLDGKVALVTGAARRLGAHIAAYLHAHGMKIVVHYRSSESEALHLVNTLNGRRPDSAIALHHDLLNTDHHDALLNKILAPWDRLDALINNASSFYPTPLGSVSREQWDDLVGSNLLGPFFLAQTCAGALSAQRGCIVNITDIHAQRPLKHYSVYSLAKAGLAMMTKALARELGPEIRVNAVAPGAILWPERDLDEEAKQRIIRRTALKRQGTPDDVARAVLYLIRDADYTTGETIRVDGGRSLRN